VPAAGRRYLRLKEAGVNVVTVAPTTVRATLEAGRTVARRVIDALPHSKRLLRKRAHKISLGLTFKYQSRCAEALRELRADVIHVMTPDPGAMALIRAAHSAEVPVLYQELGITYHPPDFAFSYQEFTAVLPLCAALADVLLRVARDAEERRRMGRAARERYETLFSPQAVLPTLLGVYRRVAGRGVVAEHAPEQDPHPRAQVS